MILRKLQKELRHANDAYTGNSVTLYVPELTVSGSDRSPSEHGEIPDHHA